MPEDFKHHREYAVFISYRHADNTASGRQWASWLHQMLESYEVPTDLIGTINNRGESVPASLYPVFRDEEELPADANLTQNIRRALENSGLLVVICSPRAVASKFVAEEIRYFKELGNSDRILALLIDGEPNTTDDLQKQKSGQTADIECLPQPLRFGVPAEDGTISWSTITEPIAADVRPKGRPIQGWTTAAAYREHLKKEGDIGNRAIDAEVEEYEKRLELAKLKIVAGSLAVPLGVLTRRDQAAQLRRARHRSRILLQWLAVVVVLAIAAVVGGSFAYLQRDRALEAERIAMEQAEKAQLAERAAEVEAERRRILLTEAARSDRQTGISHATQGNYRDALAYLARSIDYDSSTNLAAEAAIGILNTWNLPTITLSQQGSKAATSPNGRFVAIRDKEGGLSIWDIEANDIVSTLNAPKDVDIAYPLFTADSEKLLTQNGSGVYQLWKVSTGELISTRTDIVYGTNICLSRDGSRLALIIDDTNGLSGHGAAIIDMITDAPPTLLVGHRDWIRDIRFSPDGQKVITASQDDSGKIWDAITGDLLLTLQSDSSPIVQHAELSPDGKQALAFGWKGFSATVWDAESGRVAFELSHPGIVQDAGYNPSGNYIVTAAQYVGYVWDAATGNQVATLTGHDDFFSIQAFSSDGSKVITDSEDRSAKVWDMASGRLIATLPARERDEDPYRTFNSDGDLVVAEQFDDRTLAGTAEQSALSIPLVGHTGSINEASFSDDGSRVLTATGFNKYRESEDKTLRIWDTESGVQISQLPRLESDFYKNSALSPDGKRIYIRRTSYREVPEGVWNVETGEIVSTLDRDDTPSTGGHFSFDGRSLMTEGETDGSAAIWDPSTGKLLSEFQVPEETVQPDFPSPVRRAIFSNDGMRAVVAHTSVAGVWDLHSGKRLSLLEGHEKLITSLSFSPDGKQVATASLDGTVRVWDASSGMERLTIDGFPESSGEVAFSDDGSKLIVNYQKVSIWNAQNGKSILTLKDQDSFEYVTGIISPSGRLMAANPRTERNRIHLRNTADSQLIVSLDGHDDTISSMQFNPQGNRLLTGTVDGSARLWYLLNTEGLPPAWFADFLRLLAERSHNQEGSLADMSLTEILGLRAKLATLVENDPSAYGVAARRFLSIAIHQ